MTGEATSRKEVGLSPWDGSLGTGSLCETASKMLCVSLRAERSCAVRRQFRLSSARSSNSRAALAERSLAERRREAPFRPRTNAPSAGRGSDASASGTLEGEARIARLAQPRTQLWERCEEHLCCSQGK